MLLDSFSLVYLFFNVAEFFFDVMDGPMIAIIS